MKKPLFAHLMGGLAALFLAVFFFYPLLVILSRSFSDVTSVWGILSNPFYRERLLFTLWQALLSTFFTVLLGLPSALLFARFEFRGKRLLRSAFTIPFVMPSVVAAIGFLSLLGPRGLSGIDLQNSLAIILLVHVFYNYAIVVRIVGAYLETLGYRLHEAARVLGSSVWRVTWRVTLPIAMPAIIAAATLVFIFCFSSFGVILILAPDARFATLEVSIYRLTTRMLQLDQAAVLVLLQLLIISVFTWFYTHLQARLAVQLPGHNRIVKPYGAWRWLLAANILIASLLILAPLLALLYQAFWWGGGWLPSLRNFQALGEASLSVGFVGLQAALWNSLRFAVSSMLLALLVGFAFAYAVVRARWYWLDSLSLLPLATSAVTLGLGYLLAFPMLRASAWGLILAHSLIAFPFVARSLLPALRALPDNVVYAAVTLGSRPLNILRRVELPLLLPSLITAASFAFAISIGEFGASLMLTRPEYATLPVAIFNRLGRPGAANYGAALALCAVLMALTTVVMLLLEHAGKSEL